MKHLNKKSAHWLIDTSANRAIIAAAVLICISANLLISTSIFSQNLVPNPGFETFSSCPVTAVNNGGGAGCIDEFSKATGWSMIGALFNVGTPDYFNACYTGAGCSCGFANSGCVSVSVPSNYMGNQAANGGSAYAGFRTYTNSNVLCWPNVDGYVEYIQTQLSAQLVANTTYRVSMYIVGANGTNNKTRTDGIGAYFSSTQLTSVGGSCPLSIMLGITPQFVDNTIRSSANWELLTGTFVAAGGEQWLIIGEFKGNATKQVSGTDAEGYYYIDDICVATDASGFCVSALPIQLLTFTGNCTENNSVHVAWSTATETNNDYFTIERGTGDGGQGASVQWEKIGTVKGAGNSSTTKNYEFTDHLPLSFGEGRGEAYYRLTQTDFDGKTETFNNKQVAVDVTECAVKVFPNPAGNTLNIPYAAEQDGEVTLQVYDVIGKLVKEKSVTATKGNNKFTLDLTTVAQGMYVLRVKGTAKESNQKFVKVTQ